MYITDAEEFIALIRRLRQEPVVALDTEFIREKSYFAQLCLIQVACEGCSAIIDPFAVDDLSPLRELLADTQVTKVLHAASQDLAILYKECGVAAAPVFDTQLAATLAGFPQQVGLRVLVEEALGVTLGKGETYTDWAKRPLSQAQVKYALDDVCHLPSLYQWLTDRLTADGRLAWLKGDFERLGDPGLYEVVPEEQWRKVKRVGSLNCRQLGVAREVAAWREHAAMRRNVPRRWILGDEGIVEVSRRMPHTIQDLAAIRGVSGKIGKTALPRLLAAIERGCSLPEGELPVIDRQRRSAGYHEEVVDLMAALTRKRAREHDVAMPLLASRECFKELASGGLEDNPLLCGWRAELIGNELLELVQGGISLCLNNGELVVTRHEGAQNGQDIPCKDDQEACASGMYASGSHTSGLLEDAGEACASGMREDET
ncbi:MAG: ribonuclease D [Coriobacteriia bacterium]|nr:ribonuclease D [Coriobacteriia bacterium]